MECKTCGRKCHYCNSCDMDYYLSNGYCDIKCFLKSKEYAQAKGQFENFLDRLDEGTIRGLIDFIENEHYLLFEIGENEYVKWAEERLTKEG